MPAYVLMYDRVADYFQFYYHCCTWATRSLKGRFQMMKASRVPPKEKFYQFLDQCRRAAQIISEYDFLITVPRTPRGVFKNLLVLFDRTCKLICCQEKTSRHCEKNRIWCWLSWRLRRWPVASRYLLTSAAHYSSFQIRRIMGRNQNVEAQIQFLMRGAKPQRMWGHQCC